MEVSNLMCRDCKYSGDACKCIDHTLVHFFRPFFSCDVYTGQHVICCAFEPNGIAPAIVKEWETVGGFENWFQLWREQWWHGKDKLAEKFPLILADPLEGRETTDDVFYVSASDFYYCNIMRPDGSIHVVESRHIRKSRKSPTGYKWELRGERDLFPEALRKPHTGIFNQQAAERTERPL